jgi:hypothetical protein
VQYDGSFLSILGAGAPRNYMSFLKFWLQGIEDHERFFERDVFRSGVGGLCDPSLVRTLSTKSAEAIHWLIEELNVPLSVLSQLGGHSRKRTHRAPPKEVCRQNSNERVHELISLRND